MKDRFAAAFDDVGERHKGIRIGTIWRSEANGSGDVTLTADFLDMPAIYRADILRDVLGVLAREYDLAVDSIFTSGM